MSSSGPGKFNAKVLWFVRGDVLTAGVALHLYNYDIDVAEPKKEHMDFLSEEVAPFLKGNPGGTVHLHGYASRSGEAAPNKSLSGQRAMTLGRFLTGLGIEGKKFGNEPSPGAPSRSPIVEDDYDRGVTLSLTFPIEIDDVRLWSASGDLEWDDIIGLDPRSAKFQWIDGINIRVRASGAPTVWVIPGQGKVYVMPPELQVRLSSRSPVTAAASATIRGLKVLTVTRSESFRPDSTTVGSVTLRSSTSYHRSLPLKDAGPFLTSRSEYREATVVDAEGGRTGVSFAAALGWPTRGVSDLVPGESLESPDAQRLLHAGGVELLEVDVPASLRGGRVTKSVKRLIRKPADVLYYTGISNKEGDLATDWTKGGVLLDDLLRYWGERQPMNLKVAILACSWVLGIPVSRDITLGGPGKKWAKLLKSKGGPLTAILGYRDEAPTDKHVRMDIARAMGARIARGMSDDKWVQAWLEINGDHSGKNTWNAVGLDQKGYWAIAERSKWSRMHDLIPYPFPSPYDKYEIVGPFYLA